MTDPLAELKGALPGGYVLAAPIEKGGQGSVFRGTRNGSPVAIKVFGPGNLERIKREVDLLRGAALPGVVRLVDYFEVTLAVGLTPIVVYELVEGRNLRTVIRDSRETSASELLRLGAEMGAAIDGLWALRIVHRDVKPENIIEKATGGYVLVDLGIAQHLSLPTITVGGQPGTQGYRSPEQLTGRKKLTIHSDIFGLGITMFEVAAKAHPWDRDESKMMTVRPHDLRTLRPALDVRFSNAVHSMLHVQAGLRPSKAAAMFNLARSP